RHCHGRESSIRRVIGAWPSPQDDIRATGAEVEGTLITNANPLDASLSTFLRTWSHASPNPFVERHGSLGDAAWEAKLIEAAAQPEQDGVSFPRIPPAELQQRIHGHDGETALRESIRFYRAVTGVLEVQQGSVRNDTRLLDFGSGWGRIIRP